MKKINETDRAWLAGYFDGEGCLHIQQIFPSKDPEKRKKRREYRPYYSPRIYIASTARGSIEHVVKLTGFGAIKKRKRLNKLKRNWKPCYAIYITGFKNVKEFVEIMFPYLVEKKQHAEIFLKFVESRMHTHDRFRQGSSYTDEEMQLFEQLSKLNKRGKSLAERNKW